MTNTNRKPRIARREDILAARDLGPDELSGREMDRLNEHWDGMTAAQQEAERTANPAKVAAFLEQRPHWRARQCALGDTMQTVSRAVEQQRQTAEQRMQAVDDAFQAWRRQTESRSAEIKSAIAQISAQKDAAKKAALQMDMAMAKLKADAARMGVGAQLKPFMEFGLAGKLLDAAKAGDVQAVNKMMSDEYFGADVLIMLVRIASGDIEVLKTVKRQLKLAEAKIAGIKEKDRSRVQNAIAERRKNAKHRKVMERWRFLQDSGENIMARHHTAIVAKLEGCTPRYARDMRTEFLNGGLDKTETS